MYSNKIYTFIKENHLIEEYDNLVVAVSGGPDSMCLLHYLVHYRSINQIHNLKIHAAHINHHTRGEENIIEQSLIEKFCLENNIDLYVEHFFYQNKHNFHDEARKYRYNFFFNLCNKLNANKIVLAHHQDDQVETILFKMIRGSNLNGYTGMKTSYQMDKGISIIRPFLELTKDEILQYCNIYEIPYEIDSSNELDKYTRNHIRHHVVPELKAIQPDLNHKVLQLQQQLLEANYFIEENAKTILEKSIIYDSDEQIILDLKMIKQTHISVIRIILLNVIKKITNNKVELSFEKANNVIQNIFNEKPNITFDIGKDFYCIKEYERLIFQKSLDIINEYRLEITDFGNFDLPNSMKISVKKIEEKAKKHNNSIILCYNSTIWPLVIRTRRDGDYIKTKIGKKKVNRIFIDNKIPPTQRKNWPILTDRDGNILWVIGLEKAAIELDEDKPYLLISVEL